MDKFKAIRPTPRNSGSSKREMSSNSNANPSCTETKVNKDILIFQSHLVQGKQSSPDKMVLHMPPIEGPRQPLVTNDGDKKGSYDDRDVRVEKSSTGNSYKSEINAKNETGGTVSSHAHPSSSRDASYLAKRKVPVPRYFSKKLPKPNHVKPTIYNKTHSIEGSCHSASYQVSRKSSGSCSESVNESFHTPDQALDENISTIGNTSINLLSNTHPLLDSKKPSPENHTPNFHNQTLTTSKIGSVKEITYADGYGAFKISRASMIKKPAAQQVQNVAMDFVKAASDNAAQHVQYLTMDYVKAALEYSTIRKYRVCPNGVKVEDGSLSCIICARKGQVFDKVFFPCEHKCVCRSCFESNSFKICPLCNSGIKVALDHTGNEHAEYQKWLDEFRPHMTSTFTKKFSVDSKKAISAARVNKPAQKNSGASDKHYDTKGKPPKPVHRVTNSWTYAASNNNPLAKSFNAKAKSKSPSHQTSLSLSQVPPVHVESASLDGKVTPNNPSHRPTSSWAQGSQFPFSHVESEETPNNPSHRQASSWDPAPQVPPAHFDSASSFDGEATPNNPSHRPTSSWAPVLTTGVRSEGKKILVNRVSKKSNYSYL